MAATQDPARYFSLTMPAQWVVALRIPAFLITDTRYGRGMSPSLGNMSCHGLGKNPLLLCVN